MDLEVRPIRDDERDTFDRAVVAGFGNFWRDGELGPLDNGLEQERTLAVFDGDEIVGTAGAYTFELTVPGAVQVPVAGVTMVTVRATHRRRGLLTALMDRQLDDVAGRGEPIAVLTASEALIYGRFGYGLAVAKATWELDTDFSELLTPPNPGGRLRLVDKDTAAPLVGPVYDAVARTRVGEVTRAPSWWTRTYDPSRREEWPSGTPKFFTVLHESADRQVDGFARYTIEPHWTHGVSESVLRVLEVHAPDAEVEAALWRFVLDVDLVKTVTASDRPVDDPFRWRLVDPRRLHITSANDHLWVRIVDVGTALAARSYGTDDGLVLGLHDRFRPVNDGAWLVEGSPGGAQCSRTDREPDLVLSAPDLGALYLGGVSATTLAHAGRVEERTSGAVARADLFFTHHPAPWCTTHF